MAVKQTRICSYLPTRCSRAHVSASSTSFLDLPEVLRDKIYHDAQLASNSSLRILQNDHVDPTYGRYWQCMNHLSVSRPIGVSFYAPTDNSIPDEADWAANRNLNLSNRAVHADVARYVCTYNEIVLCCEEENDLSLLCNAPLYLLQSLRSLTIHLDVASFHERGCRTSGGCCHRCSGRFRQCENGRQQLKLTSKNSGQLIAAWTAVIARLSVSTDVSKLTLNLYCDIHDSSTAQQIVRPLEDMGLAKCTIRLSGVYNTLLKSIAWRAVDSATNVKSQPFRFMDLPPEIRQHILSFTDVITPRSQIFVEGTLFKLSRHYQRRPVCASQEFCGFNRRSSPASNCFATAIYPACECWRPPIPIFLVCKNISHEAKALFFSANHFIVPFNDRTIIRQRQFEGSYFIRRVVTSEFLHSLRSLELTFPAKFYDFFGLEDFSGFDGTLYRTWKGTIDSIASRNNRLRLRLHLGFTLHSWHDLEESDRAERFQQRLFHTNVHIVRPLQKLHCLELFLVRGYLPCHPADRSLQERELREHEAHLETLVMGARCEKTGPEASRLRKKRWWKYPGPRPGPWSNEDL